MTLRIGIIGAAKVATYAVIAPAREVDGVEVVAVAARDPARARAYAVEHVIPRAHDDYAALVADPAVDLVYVATPPSLHLAHALLAIAAGKPVLVEKPFALDAAQARTMLDAAAAAGVAVFEAQHSRHHALQARLRALVDGGVIGAVISAEATFDIDLRDRPDDFRWDATLGGGALMDLGVYPLTWLRGLFGEAFAVVEGASVFHALGAADAETTATLDWESGVTATIRASMLRPRGAAMAVHGARGRIEVENPLAPQLGHAVRVTVDAMTRTETVAGPGTYEAQLIAVRDALAETAPFALAADDPWWSMRAVDLVRAAASASAI